MKTKKTPKIHTVDNFTSPTNNTSTRSDISSKINEAKTRYLALVKENNLLVGRYTEKSYFGFAINISAPTLKSIYFNSCKEKLTALQKETQSSVAELSSNEDFTSKGKIVSAYTETNKQLTEIKDLIEALHTSPILTHLFEKLTSKKEDLELYVAEIVLKEELFEDKLCGIDKEDFNAIKEQQTSIINDVNRQLDAIKHQNHLSIDSIQNALIDTITLLSTELCQLGKLTQQRKHIIAQLPEDDLPAVHRNQAALNVKVYDEEELEDEIVFEEIKLEEEEPVALMNEREVAEKLFMELFNTLSDQVYKIDHLESSQNELNDIKDVCYEAIAENLSEKTFKETKLNSDIKTYRVALEKLEKLQVTITKKIKEQEIFLQIQLEATHNNANEELTRLKSEVSNNLQLIREMLLDVELAEDEISYIQTAGVFCRKDRTIQCATVESVENTIAQEKRDASNIRGNLKPLLLQVGDKYVERKKRLARIIESTLNNLIEKKGFHIDITALTNIQTSVNTLVNDKSSVTLQNINTLKNLENQYGTETQRMNDITTQEENRRRNSNIVRDINALIEKVNATKNSLNNEAHPIAIRLNTLNTQLRAKVDSYTSLNASLDVIKNQIKAEINTNLTPGTLQDLTTHDAWKITKFFQYLGRQLENIFSEKPLEGHFKISWFANDEERELATSANGLCESLNTINELQENHQMIQIQ